MSPTESYATSQSPTEAYATSPSPRLFRRCPTHGSPAANRVRVASALTTASILMLAGVWRAQEARATRSARLAGMTPVARQAASAPGEFRPGAGHRAGLQGCARRPGHLWRALNLASATRRAGRMGEEFGTVGSPDPSGDWSRLFVRRGCGML